MISKSKLVFKPIHNLCYREQEKLKKKAKAIKKYEEWLKKEISLTNVAFESYLTKASQKLGEILVLIPKEEQE